MGHGPFGTWLNVRSSHNKNNLNNKVALVTGSSRGIGAAIARLFAQEGAKVVVHGRDTNAISSVHADIERAGGTAISVAADVTKFDEIESIRRQIEETLGSVDILVANAGQILAMPGPFEGISEEGWHATINVNLTATFLSIKSFLPGMKERKTGNIITISSAAARTTKLQIAFPLHCRKSWHTNSDTDRRHPGWCLWPPGQFHYSRDDPHRT